VRQSDVGEESGVEVRASAWPWQAGAMLAVAGAAFLCVARLSSEEGATRAVVYAASAVLLLGSGVTLLLARISAMQVAAISTFPEALDRVRGEVSNLEGVRREHSKLRASMEDTLHVMELVPDAVRRLGIVAEKLESLDRAMGDERIRAQQAERREEELAKTIVDILQAEERQFRHLDAPPSDREAVERRARAMARQVASCGPRLVTPEPGDSVQPEEHDVTENEASSAVSPGSVLRCTAWGYRFRDRVLARARVTRAIAPALTLSSNAVPGSAPAAEERQSDASGAASIAANEASGAVVVPLNGPEGAQ